MKIIAACGNGMGTSLIIKLKVQDACKNLGIKGSVEAMSVGQAKGMANSVDVVITSTHLAGQFKGTTAKVLPVKNLMDTKEIEAVLKTVA